MLPGFAVNKILLEQQMDGESGWFHLLKEGINHKVGSGDEAWVITSEPPHHSLTLEH